MEMILIRHGEPDYSPCEKRGFIGQGHDLAPLTPQGVAQARAVAESPLLEGAELLVSSPYTRAMQTASEISRVSGLAIQVGLDLRGLATDLKFRCRTREEVRRLHQEFMDCHGEYPPGETRRWETVSQLSARVLPVLQKYLAYSKIIVVTHGGVIRRFVPQGKILYCHPYPIQVTEPVTCHGWV